MLFFKNCILLSDIDGTLSTYERIIPQRNLDAIHRFQKLGGLFTICTGRSPVSARKAIDVSLLNFPAIVYNGGGIYDFKKEQFLKNSFLDHGVKNHIDDVFENHPDIGIEINIDNVLYCIKYSNRSNRHILTERDKFKVYDYDELPIGNWNKVLFTGETSDIDEFSKQIFSSGENYDGYYFLRSEPGLFEILPNDAKKGIAVEQLAAMYNIPIENVFAIGDYYNDVTMLKAAGFSAAVSESPKDVKDAADYVACSCEDGAVADFIDYIGNRMQENPDFCRLSDNI